MKTSRSHALGTFFFPDLWRVTRVKVAVSSLVPTLRGTCTASSLHNNIDFPKAADNKTRRRERVYALSTRYGLLKTETNVHVPRKIDVLHSHTIPYHIYPRPGGSHPRNAPIPIPIPTTTPQTSKQASHHMYIPPHHHNPRTSDTNPFTAAHSGQG